METDEARDAKEWIDAVQAHIQWANTYANDHVMSPSSAGSMYDRGSASFAPSKCKFLLLVDIPLFLSFFLSFSVDRSSSSATADTVNSNLSSSAPSQLM
jgi:hypothetical protein